MSPYETPNGTGVEGVLKLLPRLLTFLGSVALLVVTASVYLTPPVSGYEQTLYDGFPATTWLGFGVGLVSAIGLMLYGARFGTRDWLRGVVLVATLYIFLNFLPHLHGYVMYGSGRADSLTHLGRIRSIVETGHLEPNNWYPHIHVAASALVLTADIPLALSQPLLATSFTFGYILSIALFVRRLTGDARSGRYALAAATPLLLGDFHLSLHPSTLSFLLLPSVLLLTELVRHRIAARSATAALLVLSFALVLLHPMTPLFLLGIIGTTYVVTAVYRSVRDRTVPQLRPSFLLPVGVLFGTWYFSFKRTSQTIVNVIVVNFGAGASGTSGGGGGGRSSLFQRYIDAFTSSELTVQQLFVDVVPRRFGTLLLYLGLGAVISLLVCWRVYRRRESFADIFSVSQFGVGVGIAAVFTALYLIVANPVRVSRYALLMATVLVALGVRYFDSPSTTPVSTASARTILQVVMAICIVTTALVGVWSLYDPNSQISKTTTDGARWFLDHRGEDRQPKSLRLSRKLTHYVVGTQDSSSVSPAFNLPQDRFILPTHLGYDENRSVAETFDEPTYLVLRAEDRAWYRYYDESRWADFRYYSPRDYGRLRGDVAANEVYSNGKFEVWTANGSA